MFSWGPVTAVAWSQDGEIVYGARNGEVWSYAVKTGDCLSRQRVSLTNRVSGIFARKYSGYYIAYTLAEIVKVPEFKRYLQNDRVLAASETLCVLATSGEICQLDDHLTLCNLRRGTLGELRCATIKNDNLFAGGDARGRVATQNNEREDAHNGAVCTSLAFSSDQFLLSTCEDRGVRCFNASLEIIWLGIGHTARVWQVRSGDDYIFSVGQDATICVWDMCGNLQKTLRGHSGKHVWALAVHGNIVASGGQDATLRLWPFSHQEERIPISFTDIFVDDNKNNDKTTSTNVSALALTEENGYLVILRNCGSILEYRNNTVDLVLQGSEITLGANFLGLDHDRIVVCGSRGGWVSLLHKCANERPLSATSWCAAETRTLRAFLLPDSLLAVTTGDNTCLRLFRNDSNIGEYKSRCQVTAVCGDGHLLYVGDSRGGIARVSKNSDSVWIVMWRICLQLQRQAVVCFFETNDVIRIAMRDGTICNLDKESGAVAAGPRRASKVVLRVTCCNGTVLCGWDAEQRLTVVDGDSGRILVQLNEANKTGKQLVNAMCVEANSFRVAQVLGSEIQCAKAEYNPKRFELGTQLVADGVASAVWLDHERVALTGGSGQLAIYCIQANDKIILERWLQSSIHAERAMVSCHHGGFACASEHEVREFDNNGYPLRVTRFKSKQDASDQRIRALTRLGENQFAFGDTAGVLRLISHGQVCCQFAYDASPILCMAACPELRLAHGTSTGVLIIWQLTAAFDSASVILALALHTAGLMAVVSLNYNLDLVTGGDDHALATFNGNFVETIPLARPTPVLGLAASARFVYVVTADHRLSQWRRISADGALEWHRARSQDKARSLILIAEQFLDLARPNGLALAPNDDNCIDDDTLLVFGDGGILRMSAYSFLPNFLRRSSVLVSLLVSWSYEFNFDDIRLFI